MTTKATPALRNVRPAYPGPRQAIRGYAHRLGRAPLNAGATIRVRSDARNRGATPAKRIISEVDVALLVRGARTKRDRLLLQVLYAAGLRVSEVASLAWADVLMRDKGQVQLSITGKGGIVRQVLLPVNKSLMALRGDAGANDAVFANRKTGARMGERAILGLVKRAAARAGLEAPVSPHWLRHAHASHAIDRGATLPEVRATFGHGNIATTSGYLHARPRVLEWAAARPRGVASMMMRIAEQKKVSAQATSSGATHAFHRSG